MHFGFGLPIVAGAKSPAAHPTGGMEITSDDWSCAKESSPGSDKGRVVTKDPENAKLIRGPRSKKM